MAEIDGEHKLLVLNLEANGSAAVQPKTKIQHSKLFPRLQFLLQSRLHMSRHERADIAAKPRDFFHDTRTQKRVGVLRHHENRLDVFVQLAVHQRELELKFKIGDGAQPAHNRLRPVSYTHL